MHVDLSEAGLSEGAARTARPSCDGKNIAIPSSSQLVCAMRATLHWAQLRHLHLATPACHRLPVHSVSSTVQRRHAHQSTCKIASRSTVAPWKRLSVSITPFRNVQSSARLCISRSETCPAHCASAISPALYRLGDYLDRKFTIRVVPAAVCHTSSANQLSQLTKLVLARLPALVPWHRAASPQVDHKHKALISQIDWNNTFKSGLGFACCKFFLEVNRDTYTELQLLSGHWAQRVQVFAADD